MVLAKSKKSVGLGNTLMNDRFGKGKGADRKRAITRTNHATGEQYLVNEKKDAAWVKMRSVTEQGDLDEFLATAELAGTDFTAEKTNNVKIIHTDQKNPYLLSANEERDVIGKHKQHKGRLTVPRRPKWDTTTTPEELDTRERESFLNWRRGLAELQENNDLLMTPFERNLEVWRQLWRVIERSDLIVQIVDARNPLLFRSEDLEDYVKDVDSKKENLLLINKADMMTPKQRKAWAKHLKEAGIAYRFFSAELAKAENEARDLAHEESPAGPSSETVEEEQGEGSAQQEQEGAPLTEEPAQEAQIDREAKAAEEDDDIDTQILTVEELEDIFLKHAPADAGADYKLQVGLVGYPNVGKSSTINALIGAKKVSVSSTPGKTKHFQTIHLSERVILCDCPGLVFPNFATTKADLVCNGILPIDQLREFQGPVGLVTQRIPQPFLEAIYGINIRTRAAEEGGTGIPTAPELLRAYARARGFQTQGLGQPDESRAARYILKDYVSGKLLFVSPPPGIDNAADFNRGLYDEDHLPEKRRAALSAAMDQLSVADPASSEPFLAMDDDAIDLESTVDVPLPAGPKSKKIDKGFFGPSGSQGHVSKPFNYQYTQQGKQDSLAGKHLSGRKARTAIALENGLDPKEVAMGSGKKHFKGGPSGGAAKRRTARRQAHEDDD
ncbi:GTP-binding protein [Fusarium heterosporum]|uniref:GTP-binding protein n=1 Tax=Fusarium heterosporum TaxID=42747 RepID=A0A8H5SYL7_FUSHE|nr:GTP-binding protein [Fusarium heterosporum]